MSREPVKGPSDVNQGMHQIGEVAEATGLSLRTIRHYEEVDLAPPSGRTSGGFRLYTEEDIERLQLIKQMKPLEFSLDELRQLLATRDRVHAGTGTEAEQAELLERLRMFSELAEERCANLRAQLSAAEDAVKMLHREARPRRARASRR